METGDLSNIRDIKASMTDLISGSLQLLGRQPLPDGEAIHDIRVMMKKYRAAVRLVRPLLDDTVYRREYLAGRETGRMISSWRETDVMRKTVRALKKDNPGLFLRLREDEKLRGLLRKPYSTWEEAGVQVKVVTEVAGRLTRANHRLRFISLKVPDLSLLPGEMEKSYRLAAKAYMACRNNPKPPLLHEFRKKAKTLMYQAAYFRHLNPSKVKSLEKKLNGLTQNLGRYNDLSRIMAITGYRFGDPDNSIEADELAIVIRNRQDRYLMKVWPVAYRLFTPGRKLYDLLDITLPAVADS
jgi:CHAD domain-containing protein